MAEVDAHPTFDVAVVTPDGPVFQGEARLLIVPGAAGEIGVLARHAPLVATLKAGLDPRASRRHRGARVRDRSRLLQGRDRSSARTGRRRGSVTEIDDARAQAQLDEAKAELERVEAGESTVDRWQLEQRIKHAENQLAVPAAPPGRALVLGAEAERHWRP